MTSSMLNGERRWTSARRGGMTVLGKVAVPKPINLPSQRLENHGLDPNVEIVPKGTLSWGNKSSSSATNAWGSSSVSPNTDSGSGSPSHLSGRPSSGGGGTRPSTAGSDKSHEPNASAWGPSSRPSSASGAMTLNQTSFTSLRPHSADTKSSSSQLSRFAETSENPVAWNSALTSEKVGMTPCKSDGFSLTSGDFPTLGSDKEYAGKEAESRDDRSGGVAPMKERSPTDDPKNVTMNVPSDNSWRNDNIAHNEDGSRPSVDKWPGHPQSFPGTTIPPPHYDGWHGSPASNPQGGVWYRGPPHGGHPYRTPVAPGSFPMEPFIYYPPQIPPGGLPNPQPVPHGTGPRGHHPKTGDMYRPPLHDAFIHHPGVPIRPGFYPSPVTYEGYYRPPMGYSNDRDAPFMGMPSGPAGPNVYNRYLSQSASEPVSSHGMPCGYGSGGKGSVPEQVESGLSSDNQEPYRVLLKQQGNSNGKFEEENRVNSTMKNRLNLENADQPRMSRWDNDWGLDHKKEADLRKKAFRMEAFSQNPDNQETNSSENIKAKPHRSVGNADGLSTKLEEDVASDFPEVPQSLATTAKDSTLIQKIQGLNAKARASDVQNDVGREEQNEFQPSNMESYHFASGPGPSTACPENPDFNELIDPVSSELNTSVGDRTVKLPGGAPIPRRTNRGMHGRNDHRGHGKGNTQVVDGWHKRSLVDSSGMMATANHNNSIVPARDHNASGATDKAKSSYPDGHGDDTAPPSKLVSKDSQAQRTKMRELAKQRTKQLQEEEEERTRRQRERALAKLEELNRRTVVGEVPTQGSENTSNDTTKSKGEETLSFCDPRIPVTISGDQTADIVSDQRVAAHNNEFSIVGGRSSPIFSGETLSNKLSSGHEEHILAHGPLKSLEQEAVADAAHNRNAIEVQGVASLKHKRMGNRQKHSIPSEKSSSEKLSTHVAKESKSQAIATESVEEYSNFNLNSVAESLIPTTRKKYNKSAKNKHKVEEVSASTLSTQVSIETNLVTECDKPKASQSVTDPSSDPQLAANKDANQFSDQLPLLPVVETLGKGNGQWKSQHSRRMARNLQNRSGEKTHVSDSVVWAPVRSVNREEITDDVVQKNEAETHSSSVKIDNNTQNIPKNKRAEREIYVPKPVAKEMAQQVTVHQDDSSISQTSEDVKADSSSLNCDRSSIAISGNVGFSTEHRNGDGRHNKHGRAHTSWRQRGATDSLNGQGLPDHQSSSVSITGTNLQKSNEYPQPEKVSGSSTNELASHYDEWDPTDGWNDPYYSTSIAPTTTAIARDRGLTTGKGKRPQYKGHKGMGNNNDLNEKKVKSVDNERIHTQSIVPTADQGDVCAAKENRGIGERTTTHWQPKSRMVQAQSQQSSKPTVEQYGHVEVTQTNKTESRMSFSAQGTQNSDDTTLNKSQISFVEELNAKRQGPKVERKISFSKERPYFPNQNQGAVNPVEAVPGNTDVRPEQQQQLPSSYNKSGDHNNRFGRGSESHRDWNNSSHHHHKQHHHPSTNRDRQRQNSHYEYQPVGPQPHNGGKSNNVDKGAKDNSQHSSAASRYMERGQAHSRRDGNFNKQQSGQI